MQKLELANMTPLLPRTRVWRKRSTYQQSGVWILVCPNDMKHCVSGIKKYVLDWPIEPHTWPMKIGTNPSKGWGVGIQRCWMSATTKGGTISLLEAFYNYNIFNPSMPFLYATKLGRTPNFHILEESALESNNTYDTSQKQMGECGTHGRLLCGGSQWHPLSKIWSDHQHHLQWGHCKMFHN